MTNPESSPSPDYDIHELFKEELDSADPIVEDEVEPAYSLADEDRLYTDEFMRQNERASRFLLLSVITAGVMSLGIGGWYLLTRNQAPPQQSLPLQVPAQPPVSPLPRFNFNVPTSPSAPNAPGQKTPLPDSGIVPHTFPDGNLAPTPQASPNSSGATVTPPPPPETPQ